jgi:hypothetical protein
MKKVQILKIVVEVSIVGLILFAVLIFFKAVPWMGKFNQMADRIPTTEQFNGIRRMMVILPILGGLTGIIPIIIYLPILWTLRKILISILTDSIFSWQQVALIKRLAVFYLIFTGMIFTFNLIRSISLMFKGTSEKAILALSAGLGSSLSYLITSLIAYILAEIFIAGLKLKEDDELTV